MFCQMRYDGKRATKIFAALAALNIVLIGVSGCAKKAESPVKTDEDLRRTTEQGMQQMLRDQGRPQGQPAGPR